jgi:hypothetical protein
MNGTLGKPYKFFYSARNFTSGLTDIIALVKKPDGSAKGTYSLSELSGSLFVGTYYFDLPTTQNEPEGEYSVIIYEQTSAHREIAKVTLQLTTGSVEQDINPELFGTISSEALTYKIAKDLPIYGVLSANRLTGVIMADSRVNGIMQSNVITAKISEEILTAKLLEC